jgi:hypothetical protein
MEPREALAPSALAGKPVSLAAPFIAIIVAIWLTRLSPRALASNPYALLPDCPVRAGFTAVEGGRVWYEVVGRGDATPLLILHGGPGFPHDYLEPIGRL